MNKLAVILTLFVTATLFAVDIPTAQAQNRKFGKSVAVNAQVIQLSNAGQSVTSLVEGELVRYFIEPGQKILVGQKIAQLKSIVVAKMTADYISLKKQAKSLHTNYTATKKLYDSGMVSMSELNNKSIEKNVISAKINALTSQLRLLKIDVEKLTKASSVVILYAHSSGKVSQLLQALHTVIKVDEALINIVKERAYYIKSFVPLKYANELKIGEKIVTQYNQREILTHIKQILPTLDAVTQRVIVLSSVDESAQDLYVNTYVKSILYFTANHSYIAVEKSALSFFNNEWVVFVPTKQKDENLYEVRVVKIITQDENYVAVEGLAQGETYVNAKSYYVKSMLLKSSIGDGD